MKSPLIILWKSISKGRKAKITRKLLTEALTFGPEMNNGEREVWGLLSAAECGGQDQCPVGDTTLLFVFRLRVVKEWVLSG